MRSLPALRALCAVSAEGSFSAAAASLAITQSAVSQHVAALERQAGVELVVRGLRPVELTPAGQVLVAHGQAIVARVAAAERELDEVIGRGSRQLRLGSFPTALATFVPRAIARLRSQQPAVAVSITDDHMQGLLPRLHRRELDLAVIFASREFGSEQVADDLVAVPLFTDRYRVLLPLSHRLAARDRDPAVRELKADTWVGGGSRSSWFVPVRDVCRSQGFEPRVSLTSDDYLAVQAFVAAGLGVAVVPGLAAARHVAGVRVRELRGAAPARHVGVAHPDSPLVPPTTAAFVQAVRAVTTGRRRAARDALAAAPR